VNLKASYRLIAPIYDALIAGPLARARRESLTVVPTDGHLDILVDCIGTGLYLPLLPPGHRYVATDLVGAMLRRAQPRARGLDCAMVLADSLRLPFATASFDIVVLHLIVAVVPRPIDVLAEAARVTRAGGKLIVLDKFLRPGAFAPLRRLASPLAGRFATRLDVVFEDILAAVPGLDVESDRPALASGWFRRIVIRRRGD